VERSDALLELTDGSFAEIEPKHMDDVGVAWVLTEAWNSFTAASLSLDGAAPEDFIGLRVWAATVSRW